MLGDVSVTLLRSTTYKYFSTLLDYPYDRDLERKSERLGELGQTLKTLEKTHKYYTGLSDKIPTLIKIFRDELGKLGSDMFQAEYVSIFELGIKGPLCPPYESEYVKYEEGSTYGTSYLSNQLVTDRMISLEQIDPKISVLSRIIALYNKYGVTVRGIAPDHIVVELEFMHYLSMSEYTYSNINEASKVVEYRKVQLLFLEEHLLKWIDDFLECIRVKSSLRYYYMLVSLLLEFLKADKEFLQKYSK